MKHFIVNKKTVLLIVFLIILMFFLLFFRKKTVKNEITQKRFLPPPAVSNYYKGKTQMNFNVSEEDFSFPETMPVFTKSSPNPLEEEYIVKMATRLGFNDSPKTSEDIYDGRTYIWNNEESSLTIYRKSRKISFYKNASIDTINKQLSDDAFIALGKSFISKKLGLDDKNFSFFNFIYYFAPKNSVRYANSSKEKANIIQVNFSPKIAEYPILTLNPQKTSLFTQILLDGSIFKAEYVKTDDIKQSVEKYRIKSFSKVKETIDKAKIISLNHGSINIPDVSEKFIDYIDINKITLAYLIDSPESDIYQPIFVLNGKAKTQEEEMVPVTLYLPAVENN